MHFTLHNSLSGHKEPFQPLQPGKIGLYVCGMTVYDYCHLGHARVMVAFDVIVRYLRSIGYQVSYIRNITDLDDKIFARAAENGEPFTALTDRFITAMHEDEAALGVLPVDSEPRATHHIDQIIALINRLIERGYGYLASNGDVYYRVRRFADYGRLSKRNLEELQVGARIEVGEAKEDPLDFALWKAAKPGEASWDSPWGAGRPGWHIECSAMSICALGETFDMHGGGPDLKFPHHENEIAQSEGATGKPFARYWLHVGPVRVNDEKMSKSLGNFFTIRQLLQQHQPEVIRYLLLASHYRSPINYSEESLRGARQALERFYTALRGQSVAAVLTMADNDYAERFHAAMRDDFNTPEALAVLHELTRALNRAQDDSMAAGLAAQLRQLGGLLGLLQQPPEQFLQGSPRDGLDDSEISALVEARNQARRERNWPLADQLRAQLEQAGILLDDGRDGTQWRRA
ncbi:MAG TPA: cysteine--tRNA ligase [Pseudomonadales bacterium]|jgi:cysteinyl-tRNA synthetase|nr:cysteine--tRNA ligase [Pseudomonadales bacterium]HNN36406.1 cysteine--tRNA ligase [Pseudomonadales bacterium]HNV55267.1 cysteine--tRNA ligase [Pseudomonadales bacterium]